jgi:hypothetical protein
MSRSPHSSDFALGIWRLCPDQARRKIHWVSWPDLRCLDPQNGESRGAIKVIAALDRGKSTLLAVISLAATGAAPLTVIVGGATTGWLVTGVLGNYETEACWLRMCTFRN